MNYKLKLSHLLKKANQYFYIGYDFLCKPKASIDINKKKIIFLGEFFPVRIQRLAELIKSEIISYEIVLYISDWGNEPKLIGNHFDRVVVYRNSFHLLNLFKTEENILLIHSFEPKAFFQNKILKLHKAPFLYDIQDITINYYGLNPPLKWQKTNLIYENQILKNADGFVSQSLELKEAFRQHQIKNTKPSLFFPLYCNSKNFFPVVKRSSPYNKLVYIGGINSIDDSSSISNFLPFLNQIKDTNLSLTIFPSPLSEIHFYKMYKIIEHKFNNFEIKKSVPFTQINLTDYHFGVVPFEHPKCEEYLSKNRYASSMKVFVYIEMGIPIIVSEYWGFLSWIVKRYNLGIVCNYDSLNNLDELIENTDYNKILENISVFRKKYDLWNQRKKLFDFYNLFNSEIM